MLINKTRLVVALASLCALALAAPAAQAAATATCDPGALTQPFKPWVDFSTYAQVPGGTFENGMAGWSHSAGAKVVDDNEPWNVSGDGSSALELPRGASVTSPSFCGGLAYPTVRLFAKGSGGLLSLPLLSVEILYTGNDGLVRALPLGVVVPGRAWAPTLPLLTLSGLPLVTGSRLALRFTSLNGTLDVDDIYVDPYCRMR